MANSLNSNPKVLDTTGATSLISSPCHFKAIRYVGATTAGHGAILKDSKGNNIIFASKVLANTVDIFAPDGGIDCPEGISLSSIDSGTLYLYS